MITFSHFTQEQLARLNSATKYPSIFTYHSLGEKGRLTEELTVDFTGEDVFITEKIDGTNARIILPPFRRGAPIIGSREELLHYVGDLIRNPSQGIVDTVLPLISPNGTSGMSTNLHDTITVMVRCTEARCPLTPSSTLERERPAFGSSISHRSMLRCWIVLSRRLLPGATTAVRGSFPLTRWRISPGPLVCPRCRGVLSGSLREAPPTGLGSTLAWLEAALPASFATLDAEAGGRPEGVVVRTADRSKIAKIRFEDYRRTLAHEERMSRQRG